MIATIFPKSPKRDTAVSRTPSVINPNRVVRSAADLPNPVGMRNYDEKKDLFILKAKFATFNEPSKH